MRMMAREKGNSSCIFHTSWTRQAQRKMFNLCSFACVQMPRALCFHFQQSIAGWRGD